VNAIIQVKSFITNQNFIKKAILKPVIPNFRRRFFWRPKVLKISIKYDILMA
jgi:hypothetical protein